MAELMVASSVVTLETVLVDGWVVQKGSQMVLMMAVLTADQLIASMVV